MQKLNKYRFHATSLQIPAFCFHTSFFSAFTYLSLQAVTIKKKPSFCGASSFVKSFQLSLSSAHPLIALLRSYLTRKGRFCDPQRLLVSQQSLAALQSHLQSCVSILRHDLQQRAESYAAIKTCCCLI